MIPLANNVAVFAIPSAKEENTVVSEPPQVEQRSIMMDKPVATETLPVAAEETKKNGGEDDTMEKVLSKFDMNCCVKNPTKQIEEETKTETLNGDDGAEGKGDDPSLSELAARMNDIDLESGGETAEDDFHADTTKPLVPWYREPFYASLIVLCSLFTIAIIVMAVLLFKK